MKKDVSPECVFCPGKQDNAYHTFFDCDRCMTKKIALEAEIGEITPNNIRKMLQNEKSWSAVAKYVEEILRTKNLLTAALLGAVCKSDRYRRFLHAAPKGGGLRRTYKVVYLFIYLFIYIFIYLCIYLFIYLTTW